METSSVKVFESRNSTYEIKGGQELIFRINRNINLIDQKNTFLKFNLRLGGKDEENKVAVANVNPSQQMKFCLDKDIGAESLIKSITILTGDESQTLCQIQDYNKLAKLIATYTDNTTKKNLKNLYEGRGDLHILGLKNQLWELDNITGNFQQTDTLSYRTIECCLPLRHAAIIGGQDIYPNMLTGLVVKIQLEDDVYNCVQAQGQISCMDVQIASFNEVNSNQNVMVGYNADNTYSIIGTNGLPMTDAANAVNTESSFVLSQIDRTQTTGTTKELIGTGILTGHDPTGPDNKGISCLPFSVGSRVQFTYTVGGNEVNRIKKVVSLGYANNSCQITVDTPVDFINNQEDFPSVHVLEPEEKPNITLSDVELIVGVVIPNEKERNSYLQAASKGYNYDYYSYNNYPVNISENSTVISNLINCKLSKAKSILSTFTDLLVGSSAANDSLAFHTKESFQPNKYHYILDNLKTPNRDVKVDRLNKNPQETGSTNAIQIKEIADAFKECNLIVENLNSLKTNLIIARGLSRYNHTYNFMNAKGETRLNIQCDRNTNSLLNHNFIYHWKRLNISPQGVVVSE